MIPRFFRPLPVAVALALPLALATGAAGCVTAEPGTRGEPRAALVPAALTAAHHAYLEGDWIALGERVRDVLLDAGASELARENALELLDKAYEVNAGKLPSAFKLPGFSFLQYGNVHGMSPDGPFHRIFLRGRMRDASHVTGVTVRRLPDETVLDRATGKGTFEIKHDEPGFEDINLDAFVPELPADGVFTVRIALDDGTATEGWFIGRGLASTSVPEVRSPVSSASFSERNPTVRWAPFRSPQYADFERRTLSVYVSKEGSPAPAWDLWAGEPGELGEVRIGDHDGADRIRLDPGDYWVTLGAGEERSFGPVRLVRVSRTAEPFHVLR